MRSPFPVDIPNFMKDQIPQLMVPPPAISYETVSLDEVMLDALTTGAFSLMDPNGAMIERSHKGLITIGGGLVVDTLVGTRFCEICREQNLAAARANILSPAQAFATSLHLRDELEQSAMDGIWICRRHIQPYPVGDDKVVLLSHREAYELRGGDVDGLESVRRVIS